MIRMDDQKTTLIAACRKPSGSYEVMQYLTVAITVTAGVTGCIVAVILFVVAFLCVFLCFSFSGLLGIDFFFISVDLSVNWSRSLKHKPCLCWWLFLRKYVRFAKLDREHISPFVSGTCVAFLHWFSEKRRQKYHPTTNQLRQGPSNQQVQLCKG